LRREGGFFYFLIGALKREREKGVYIERGGERK